MVGQVYLIKLQLNKANSADTEAPLLDLDLSITNGIVSSKFYDKWEDFYFEISRYLMEMFLDPLLMVYIFLKVSKGAKIRNRHNQVPHLTLCIPMGK